MLTFSLAFSSARLLKLTCQSMMSLLPGLMLSPVLSWFCAVSRQFSTLANHEIEGMDNLIKSFIQIVEEFKRKPYDLLDYSRNAFDRDFLEFNVNVAELETALQVKERWLQLIFHRRNHLHRELNVLGVSIIVSETWCPAAASECLVFTSRHGVFCFR